MLMANQIELRGSFISVLYGPRDDGFSMISLSDDEGKRIVASGRMIPENLEEGDELLLKGRWKNADRGPILQVSQARKGLPQTIKGITHWLTKAKIPGVGKVRAEKLVARFGLDTIKNVVAEHEDAVKILGPKVIKPAANNLKQRMEESEIGSMLSGYGVNTSVQTKIVAKYGDRTHHVLMNEPYELIVNIRGIAFTTADKIAQSSGIARNDKSRIRAGIIETMRKATLDGHCAMYHQTLIEQAEQILFVDQDLIEEQIETLAPNHIVEIKINEMRGWALAKLHAAELRLAANVHAKLNDRNVVEFDHGDIKRAVQEAQERLGITLNREQAIAARMALKCRLSILTGGPGTGKTQTLKIIIEAWNMLAAAYRGQLASREIKLGAPTGKAAKRAAEVTGLEAKTLHRLLEFKPDTGMFERNSTNPIEAGMIAIDESSMPDIYIARDLSQAWGHSKVLLIGDTEQLPSVGPGKVLADLLESGEVPHTRLQEIYRQSAGSEIALGAEAIKNGRVPEMGKPGTSELVFISMDNTADIAERITDMVINSMPKYLEKKGLDPTSIQVLSPGKQGEVGTLALNRLIQSRTHHDKNGPKVMLSDQMEARVGDKVIQLENDYSRNIFNGDTGKIIEIDLDEKGRAKLTHVDFGDQIVAIEGATISNMTLAYALTIHKSQGSEYQVVIIPVTNTHYTLMKRNLIYTGETRAKRICVFIGSKKALAMAVQREDSSRRVTCLANLIKYGA